MAGVVPADGAPGEFAPFPAEQPCIHDAVWQLGNDSLAPGFDPCVLSMQGRQELCHPQYGPMSNLCTVHQVLICLQCTSQGSDPKTPKILDTSGKKL